MVTSQFLALFSPALSLVASVAAVHTPTHAAIGSPGGDHSRGLHKGDSLTALSRRKHSKHIYIIRHGEKIASDTALGQLAKEGQCLSEKGWSRAYSLVSIFGPRPQPPFRSPDAIFSENYRDAIDCRDKNGWYRTQQIVSAVARKLNVTVDNSTGSIPSNCNISWADASKPWVKQHKCYDQPEPFNSSCIKWVDEQLGGGDCYPFGLGAEPPSLAGMCCNKAAATRMLEKLRETGIESILVGWEHSDIQYLSIALGQDSELFNSSLVLNTWASDDFDRIYMLSFDAHTLEFESIDTHFMQDFDYPYSGPDHVVWPGPQTYCGAVDPTIYPVNRSSYPLIPVGRYSPEVNGTYHVGVGNS